MSPILLNLRFLPKALVVSLAFLLLGNAHVVAQTQTESKPLISYQRPPGQTTSTALPQQLRQDHAVTPAGFETAPSENAATPLALEIQPPNDPRQLAPQSHFAANLGKKDLGNKGSANNGRSAVDLATPQIESLTTAGTGLAIVVGLFFVCMWLMRRSGPKPTTPLPKEAVAVLGRVPLAARNFAHLIQVGNKLVLVAITPEGVTPITEVTDPGEVDQLLSLCLRKHKHSTTAEFHNVLQKLANEPAKGFLGNEAHAMSAGVRR